MIIGLLLILIPFVSAISEVFVQTQDDAILIEYPKLFVLKQNEDFHLRFHAFNKTNGKLLTNETINCTFNLYDSFGEGILRVTDLDFDVDEGTQDCQNCFNHHIDKGNFTTVGSYSYLIRCENDAIGGAVSVGIEVTGTGFEFTQPRSTFSLGLIGLLIFLFIVTILGVNKLPSTDNYKDGELMSINQLKYLRPILWVVAWFLIVAMVFTASNIAFAYMGSTLLAEILFTVFNVMFRLSLPMIIVWFCYVFYSMFKDKQMKKYLERGWE